MRHLKRSLSEAEREALLLEDAAKLLDELQSGAVKRVSGDEWYERGKGA